MMTITRSWTPILMMYAIKRNDATQMTCATIATQMRSYLVDVCYDSRWRGYHGVPGCLNMYYKTRTV
eukprot:11619097-Karenia_brevis.AAC.1